MSVQSPYAHPETINANLKQTWNFSVRVFDDFLLRLFEKYAELLKRRFSDDFQEVRTVLQCLPFLLTFHLFS